MSISGNLVLDWSDQGFIPDAVIRTGVQRLLAAWQSESGAAHCDEASVATQRFVERMRKQQGGVASGYFNNARDALPREFYARVLGDSCRFTSGWWPDGVTALDAAQDAAMSEIAVRAALQDGQDVLEYGAGWGGVSLWVAQQFPQSRIVAVTARPVQRAAVQARADALGLRNVEVVAADLTKIDYAARFDRVIATDIFEYERNWEWSFQRIAKWLRPEGRFFLQTCAQRDLPYDLLRWSGADWLAQQFLPEAVIPSDDLALHFQRDLTLLARWRWDGTHTARTSQAWLENLERHHAETGLLLEQHYGMRDTAMWWMRWRIFFIACAEVFGSDAGQRWWVSHYQFERSR